MRPEDIPADLRHIQPIALPPQPKDPRDFPARAFGTPEILPRRARVFDPFPVKNQGAIGSCVGQAIASMLQIYFYRTYGASPEISALQVYFLGRVIDGSWMADVGTYPRSALKGVMRWGAAPEELWRNDMYDTRHATTEPDRRARMQATFWRPKAYVAPATLNEVKSSIAQGYPVVFTTILTKGFYDTRYSGGDVPETYDGEPANGAHELLADEYDDDTGRVYAKNSWGESVGNRGRFSVPYNFFERGTAYDAHALR